MSWNAESESSVKFSMGPIEKWKAQTSKIEQTFNKLAQLVDGTKRKLQVIKANRSDICNLEREIQPMKNLIIQVSEEINELEKMANLNNQDLNSRKFMIKGLRKRAGDQTKIVHDLCTTITKELQDREIRRKKEISITSHELDFNEDSMRHSEQMTIDDSELKTALDEQKQMERLNREVIQLEDMFLKLNNMVEEQGEMVDRIEVNIVNAYTNVESGETELGKAVNYKRSATKKKLIIIGIVIAVLAILALIIGLAVGIKH